MSATIRVRIECYGDECDQCRHLSDYGFGTGLWCDEFRKPIRGGKRCAACKRAEISPDKTGSGKGVRRKGRR
jgi:hypothetical protein